MEEMERLEDYRFKVPRSGEVETAIHALSDCIAALKLPKPDNDRLVDLATDVLVKAEVNAFKHGMGFGVHIGKEAAFDPPPLPHFMGDLYDTVNDADAK